MSYVVAIGYEKDVMISYYIYEWTFGEVHEERPLRKANESCLLRLSEGLQTRFHVQLKDYNLQS